MCSWALALTLFTQAIYEDACELPDECFLHPALFVDDLDAELARHDVLWGPRIVSGPSAPGASPSSKRPAASASSSWSRSRTRHPLDRFGLATAIHGRRLAEHRRRQVRLARAPLRARARAAPPTSGAAVAARLIVRSDGSVASAHRGGDHQEQPGGDAEGQRVSVGECRRRAARRGQLARAARSPSGLAAIVASAARPIEAPTVRDVLSRPEASPASRGGTPAVPATAIGVTARPMPRPIRTNGPSRSPRKVDVVV